MNSTTRFVSEYSYAEVRSRTYFRYSPFLDVVARACDRAIRTQELQYIHTVGSQYHVSSLKSEQDKDFGFGEHCLIVRALSNRVIVSEYFSEFPRLDTARKMLEVTA